MSKSAEDKLMWTLVRPESAGVAEFQRYVLEELAVAAGGLVADATSVRVTLQEPNAFWARSSTSAGTIAGLTRFCRSRRRARTWRPTP